MDFTPGSSPDPAAPAAGAVIVPDCPTAPLHPDELGAGWDIEPDARARIVDWLGAMSARGAKDKNGPVSARNALRAMRTLGTYGRIALERRKLDRQAQALEAGSYALKDHVTPVIDLAGPRMTEEAHRQGLDCAAALDRATQDAIYDAAEAELQAAGVDTDPAGVDRPQPARRGSWVIARAMKAQVVARLVGMVDPQGAEAPELTLRERLMAARVLGQFDRLALEEEAFEREVRAAGPAFDRERVLDEMDEIERQHLEWRRRDDEEVRRRRAAAARPGGEISS